MPYLECLRDKKGYVAVKQGNIKAAANAVIKLLVNDEFRKVMGQEARNSIEEFYNFDIASEWEKVFQIVIEGSNTVPDFSVNTEELNIMLNTILFHYKKGCNYHNSSMRGLSNMLEIESPVTYIHRNLNSFVVGENMVFVTPCLQLSVK